MVRLLETERLVLFPYTKENLHLFNTDLSRFEEEFGVVYRGEELDHLLVGFLKKLETEIEEDPEHFLFFTEFLIVLKENSHVIGSIDYKYVPKDGTTEVGYGMNPAYTGRGYMTEALNAFLKFGASLGITRVLADTLPDNEKSQNVLKRCGFTHCETMEKRETLWWERILQTEQTGMDKKTYEYITLKERPELKKKAAEWFHGHWGVPTEAYLKCMDEYLSGQTKNGWYLCLDGERIVGGMGVIDNDFHDRKDLSPNVCAVYTEEAYRKQGIAGKLLNMVVEDMRAKGVSPLYLVTDHTGFYERYGWEFLCMALGDGEPDFPKMYNHR